MCTEVYYGAGFRGSLSENYMYVHHYLWLIRLYIWRGRINEVDGSHFLHRDRCKIPQEPIWITAQATNVVN